MKEKRQNIKLNMSIFLTTVLIFPLVFNFIHQFNSHQHFKCSENKSHLHQYFSDCETCDFNHLTLEYNVFNNFDSNSLKIYSALKFKFSSSKFSSFLINNIQLRAPPTNLC